MKRIVLDASAVMAFFQDRPGAEKIEELMTLAVGHKRELLLSVVNWGEVYYSVWRANGRQAAIQVAAEMAQLPIRVVDADVATTKIAAAIKAEHKLPYADCFAASLAMLNKTELVTADKDFKAVEKQVSLVMI